MPAIRVLRRFRELQDVTWPTVPVNGQAVVYDAASDDLVLAPASGVPGPPGPAGPAGPTVGVPGFSIDTQAVETATRSGFTTFGKWDPGATSGFRYRELVFDNIAGHWIQWSPKFTAGPWTALVYVVGGVNTGKAIVSVDGTSKGSFDTYSSTADTDTVLTVSLGTLTEAAHAIRLTVDSTANPSSGGSYIVLRHLIFLPS